MKTQRVFGWAVIFTVTLLLAACASHTPKVADTDITSGPDTTLVQLNDQGFSLSEQRLQLDTHKAHLMAREGYTMDRQQQLERQENAVVIHQAWLNERESQLDQRTLDLERRENALVIQHAWLNEQEARMTQGRSDLPPPVEMAVFTTSSVKLAGADSSPYRADSSPTKTEAGRCYASVVYPAEYKTVAVVKPIGQPEGENLPVMYQSVTEKVKVTDEQMRWEEILCEDSMTDCRITEIQRALFRGGYNPGPIDGVVGLQTMAAVNTFQKDFNLTVANHLTIETVKALDANF
jgi:hypothetical protein